MDGFLFSRAGAAFFQRLHLHYGLNSAVRLPLTGGKSKATLI